MAIYKPAHTLRRITTQFIDVTSAVAASAGAAFGTQTYNVRLASTVPCHYHVYDTGTSSTCSSNDPLLPAAVVEIIGVTPGQNITAKKTEGTTGTQASSDGRLTIVELT